MFCDPSGATQRFNDYPHVHAAYVKPRLTTAVKRRLASATPTDCKIGGMFDDDGKFTPEARAAIARRMDQTIRLAKLTKSAVADRMGFLLPVHKYRSSAFVKLSLTSCVK